MDARLRRKPVAYRPPIDTRSVTQLQHIPSNGYPEKALNFLTPHQKWGIHSTYSENLLMLTMSRGGPIIWMSEDDARELEIKDNDWVEVFNANGALTCRAVVSQRVKPGSTMMYHAQERITNIPGSEVTGIRGGFHNSVTRICPKPTHMIGGYAHLAYSFNYYGTVGSNRDEYIMIRKMKTLTGWMAKVRIRCRGEKMRIRSQVGMVMNLDKCIGCHTCSITCKTSGPGAKGWSMPGSTTSRPSRASATRKPGKIRRSGKAAGSGKSTASWSRGWAARRASWRKSSPTPKCRASMTITSRSASTISTCITRRRVNISRPRVRAR